MARSLHRVLAIGMATIIAVGTMASGALGQSPSEGPPALSARIDAAIAATAQDLLFDVDAQRVWVAEHIDQEDYEGTLKGPRGTFLTRAANELDKVRLLGAFLDASLVPYRFASCELADGNVAGAATTDAVPTSHPATPPDEGTLAIESSDEIIAAITDPELRSAFEAVVQARDAARSSSAAAATVLADAIETAPDAVMAGPTGVASSGSVSPENGPPALYAHVWIQAMKGPTWRDLDLTTESGEPPCTAEGTFDRLPERWDHRVRLALEVEQRVAGSLVTSEALSVTVPTADVATSPITFGFGESGGFLSGIPWTSGTLVRHTPVLAIDGQVTSDTPLSLPPSGVDRGVLDRITDALGSGDEGGGALGGGALGGVLGDESSESEVPGDVVEPEPITGAWLRIDLLPPDGPPVELRSDVFDRIGIEARAAGTAESADVQPLAEVSGGQSDLLAMWQIGLLLGEVRAPEGAADGLVDPTSADGLAASVDAWLRIFPAAYHDLGGRGTGPTVLLAGITEALGADGEPASGVVLDALHVPGPDDLDAPGIASDAQAVVAAETLMLDLLELRDVPLGDAAAVFEAAHDQGIGLRWLAPGDDPSIPGASAAAQARMRQRLTAGQSLLTPVSAPSLAGVTTTAWWTRDPASGLWRDEHESGRHADMVEDTVQTEQSITWAKRYRDLACRYAGAVALAGSLLYVGTGGAVGGDAVKGVVKIAQTAEENRKRGEAATKIACAGSGASGATP